MSNMLHRFPSHDLVISIMRCTILMLLLALTYNARCEITVRVICEATCGRWEVEVHPSWSPNGAKRYLDLVADGFFDNTPLFRAVPGFLVQFGISMDAAMNNKWSANIQDDPFPMHVRPMQNQHGEAIFIVIL